MQSALSKRRSCPAIGQRPRHLGTVYGPLSSPLQPSSRIEWITANRKVVFRGKLMNSVLADLSLNMAQGQRRAKIVATLGPASNSEATTGVADEIFFCIVTSYRERNPSQSPKRHHAPEFGRHLQLWHRIEPGQPACSFFHKPQGAVRQRRYQIYSDKTRPLPSQLH